MERSAHYSRQHGHGRDVRDGLGVGEEKNINRGPQALHGGTVVQLLLLLYCL